MIAPMVFLAILAVISGFWNVTGQFNTLMGEGETHGFFGGLFGVFTHPLPWIALIVAALGIFLAYAIYSKKWLSAEKIGATFKPIYTVFYRKYYFDELYENIFVKTVLMKGLFAIFQFFDSRGVDGVVNGVANGTVAGGKAVRQAQTGQLQLYALFFGVGIVIIFLVVYFAG